MGLWDDIKKLYTLIIEPFFPEFLISCLSFGNAVQEKSQRFIIKCCSSDKVFDSIFFEMDYLFPSFLSCKRYFMGKLEQSSKYRSNQRLHFFYLLIYLFLRVM